MPITPLFAAVFGLMYLFLSIGVIRVRMSHGIALGTKNNRSNDDTLQSTENKELQKAVRIHANFAEYVPLCILLLWFIETISFNSTLVFWLASLLLVSRVLHVMGMLNHESLLILRQLGVIGTFSVIVAASSYVIWWYLPVSL